MSDEDDESLNDKVKEWQNGIEQERYRLLDEWQSGQEEEKSRQFSEFVEQSQQAEGLSDFPETIAHLDPEIIEAYISALRDGKEKQNNIRLMVVGFADVGKTSLVRNLLGLPYIEPESTDGVDIYHHQCSKDGDWSCKEEHTEEREIERLVFIHRERESVKMIEKHTMDSTCSKEIASEQDIEIKAERPKSLAQRVFNVFKPKHRPASGVTLRNRQTTTRRTQSDTEALFMNNRRTDIHNSPVKTNNILTFSEMLKQKAIKADQVVQVWDFGGQFVYYATHQLFLSRLAVYILVVDASKDLDDIVKDEKFPEGSKPMSVKSFYKFWLQSIHSFVADSHGGPVVILVATHTDKVENWNQEKEAELFGNIRSLFKGSPLDNHIGSKQFAINNKGENDVVLERLRCFIIKTADASAARCHKIPAKWIPLENCLTQRKKDKIITFEEVIKLDSENEFPIGNSYQIKMFLIYHHDMGNLTYFDDEGVCELVVLDPQWIVDAFRCIIKSKKHFYSCGKLSLERQKLFEEAILSNELIQEVWQNDNSNNFFKYKKELLLYLNKLGIVANVVEIDIDKGATNNLNTYIVPSLMKRREAKNEIEDFLKGRTGTSTTMVFSFENHYVSPTLFHRVTALALGKWKVLVCDGRRLLFENKGVYEINETHAGLVEQFDKTIEIRAVNLCNKDIDCRQTDKFRRYVKAMLLRECSRLKAHKTKSFKLGIRCNYDNIQGKAVKYIDELAKCVTQIIPCPDRILGHDIDLHVLKSEWQIETIHISPPRSKKLSVSASKDERKVSERELNKIAGALGQNWELLGAELGIKRAKIEQIKMDNPLTSSVQIFVMLKTWLNTNSEKATMGTLLEHITSVKQLTVEMDEIKNVYEGFY